MRRQEEAAIKAVVGVLTRQAAQWGQGQQQVQGQQGLKGTGQSRQGLHAR